MPEPSKLVLLEQLHSLDPGTKVRFLGGVNKYDAPNARLVMREHYPSDNSDAPTVMVNVYHLLEGVDRQLLQVGAWLNVIGYVRSAEESIARSSGTGPQTPTAFVEATMLWSAGAIKLDRYRSAVAEYQQPLSEI